MRVFEIDFKKLAVLLTPTFLRRAVFTSLVRVLMQPLATLHFTFAARRTDSLFRLEHNGQVCRLKHALNSLDGSLTYANGFEISDINAVGEVVWAYDEHTDDSRLVWFLQPLPDNTMIYNLADITADTSSFVVFVPGIFAFNGNRPADPRIVATVERYRLLSRTASYRAKT